MSNYFGTRWFGNSWFAPKWYKPSEVFPPATMWLKFKPNKVYTFKHQSRTCHDYQIPITAAQPYFEAIEQIHFLPLETPLPYNGSNQAIYNQGQGQEARV